MEIEFVEEGGELRLRKAAGRAHPVEKLFGVLGRSGDRTDDYLEEIRGR